MCDKSCVCVVSHKDLASLNAVNVRFAPRSPARVVAVAVVGIEAAFVALAAVLYVVFAIVGDSDARGLSLGVAALAALAAIGLGLLARGLAQARRWAVSPSITWQVLQGFVGAFAVSVGTVVPGIASIALAVIGCVSLVLLARADASADPSPR